MVDEKKTKYNLQVAFILLASKKHVVEQQKDLSLEEAKEDIDLICNEHESGIVKLQNIILAPVL